MTIARREFIAGLAAAGGTTLLGKGGASAQGPSRRYTKPVIDLHFHWYPQEFIDLLEKEGEANGAVIQHSPDGSVNVTTPTKRTNWQKPTNVSAPTRPGRFGDPSKTDVDVMLEEMDDVNIDMEVLTQTNPHIIWAPPEYGARLARAINDGNSRLHQQHADRFMGTISLPMQDVELALTELERAAKLPGMRAINLTEHVREKNVGHRSFWPVYERAEQLGLPLFFKNVDTISERMNDEGSSMMNILSNPFEATIAAASMMLTGAMDEFPDLEVYMPHAGGFFAFVNPRIEWARDHMGGGSRFDNLKQPVSAYLRRFHYDLILHSPMLSRTLIDMVGVDRLACGTDRPQAMNIPDPIAYVEAIPGITAAEAEAILCDNPARLLKL